MLHRARAHPLLCPLLLLAYILIPKQSPQPSRLVIHNRFRISQFLEFILWHVVVWIVDRFSF
jgi:hypothetical protein